MLVQVAQQPLYSKVRRMTGQQGWGGEGLAGVVYVAFQALMHRCASFVGVSSLRV